jgi:predicted dithiol-disulfide oxidoreductase (DUF899 family)
MTIRFPNESSEYRAARDKLLEEEVALRRQMEAVAAARRALPEGGPIPTDYVFDGEGPNGEPAKVKLSELFGDKSSLVVYSMMFPRDPDDTRPGASSGATAELPLLDSPCPSCTALLDQLDGSARHVAPLLSFVVVGRAPFERLQTFAKERGWRNLRFVSAAANDFTRDYHGQNEGGANRPMLNVFTKNAGQIRHFWGSEMLYAPGDPGQDPRHVGTLEPSWNILDLTREGRGEHWDELLDYPGEHCCH